MQLDKLTFDLELLRVLVNVKRLGLKRPGANNHGYKEMARTLGLAESSLRNFCHGGRTNLELRTVIRLLHWVGVTDLETLTTEE